MKSFLKFIFKGLFSNMEVIEGSKKRPLWIGLIVLLFSLICSIIPTFVSIAQTKGSSIITSNANASLDTSLVLFTQHLNDNNLDVVIDEKGKLVINKISNDENNPYEYVVKAQDRNLLAVRIIAEYDDNDKKNTKENEAISKYREMYASGKLKDDDPNATKPISNLIISRNYVYITTYLNTETYENTLDEEGKILKLSQANATFGGQTECAKNTSVKSFYNASNDKAIDTCVNKWKTFCNDLYSKSKTQYLWSFSGMIIGLNAAVTLLVALVIMILTRLKSATGDKLNYFQALNCVCYASLCPALLTIALGFIIPSIAQIGFILLLSLRSTFLGMKAANPPQEA